MVSFGKDGMTDLELLTRVLLVLFFLGSRWLGTIWGSQVSKE